MIMRRNFNMSECSEQKIKLLRKKLLFRIKSDFYTLFIKFLLLELIIFYMLLYSKIFHINIL